MARDEILKMEHGEALDILVGREIFQSPELWFPGNVGPVRYRGPEFSRHIMYAIDIVEKMHDDGWHVVMNTTCDDWKYDVFMAKDKIQVCVVFEHLAAAICKCALIAKLEAA